MPKKRNSAKKSTQNIQSIGCPHAHTHTLPQLEIDVCFNCLIIYYSDYEYRKIEDSKEASQSIRVLKTYLEDIKVTAQVNRFHIQHKSFFDDLNTFFSDLDLLNKRLEVSIQQNSYQEFTAVKEESLKLKQKLESSQMMDVYSKYKVRSLLERRVNGVANNEIWRSIDKSASKHNEDASKQEVMIIPKEETKGTPKDEYTILMENYAEKYSEVVSKVQHLENEKSELETKAIQLNDDNIELVSKFKECEEAYNKAKERCSKLETEVDNSNSKHLEDEKRIDELEEGNF